MSLKAGRAGARRILRALGPAADLRVAAAAITMLAIQFAPTTATAEYYTKLGYSTQDVERYKTMAASIGSCSAAIALDPADMRHVDVRRAPRLATLYGQCRKALEARHASLGVLRVNDTMLGLQCMVIGGSGQDVNAIPACGYKPYLPASKTQ